MGILEGKVAIVTGAGHGIGRGEALELAAEGARVLVNDLGGSAAGDGADKRAADGTVEVITARGGEAVANYDDISTWEGASNAVAQAYEAFGGHDIVVNNAGIIRDKMIVTMSEEDFDSVIRVHLKGTFAVTHHACVRWRERSKAGEVACHDPKSLLCAGSTALIIAADNQAGQAIAVCRACRLVHHARKRRMSSWPRSKARSLSAATFSS